MVILYVNIDIFYSNLQTFFVNPLLILYFNYVAFLEWSNKYKDNMNKLKKEILFAYFAHYIYDILINVVG